MKFRIVPLVYHTGDLKVAKEVNYLREVGNLPKDIEFVCSCDGNKSEEIEQYKKYCGERPIMVWSNYFPELYKRFDKLPKIIRPYRGGDNRLHNITVGHMYLPLDLPYEESAIVSWYSAADYMWNPVNYNALDCEKRILRSIKKLMQ